MAATSRGLRPRLPARVNAALVAQSPWALWRGRSRTKSGVSTAGISPAAAASEMTFAIISRSSLAIKIPP